MSNPDQRQQVAAPTTYGQEALVAATQAWAESVRQISGAAQQTPGRPADMTDFVDWSFDLARQLLDAQQEITRSLLQALVRSGDALREAAGEGVRPEASGEDRTVEIAGAEPVTVDKPHPEAPRGDQVDETAGPRPAG